MLLIFIVNLAAYASEVDEKSYTDHLVFVVNSNESYHNDELFLNGSPTIIRDGVTYIPMRVLAERLGLSVYYDNHTKKARISNALTELQFQVNQAQYHVNNQSLTSTHGVPFVENQTLMVPLRVFVNHFEIKVVPQLEQNAINLYWSIKPVAKFSVYPDLIYAGETKVTYWDEYGHPHGKAMKDEIWEGNKEIFSDPGTYIVKRIVQDENGIWSDPFEVSINVLRPNQPPVAKISTNKTQYSIGEPITYIDLSYDDENAIVTRTWTNNEPAFFEAGVQEISLEVTDRHGLTDTYTKTITISNNVMYTREQFNLLFTPVGEKYGLIGKDVLTIPKINYDIKNEYHTLYRCNSSETIRQEGIYYRDVVQGSLRLMVHKQNQRTSPVHIYLVATNVNNQPIVMATRNTGMGGPHEWVTTTGKQAVTRYLQDLMKTTHTEITLQPGESRVIFTDISQRKIFAKQTLSAYADISSSLPVQIQTVILDTGKDILKELPSLPDVINDGLHPRGTFNYGNRSIAIREEVGRDTKRIVFGDPLEDTLVTGIDKMTGDEVINPGNYGVLYKLKLEKVAPNSVLTLNARGGPYSGAFLVNNKIVMVTEKSHLLNPNEGAILYKTGAQGETVDIVFIPASGSNLPITILIEPLPDKRH